MRAGSFRGALVQDGARTPRDTPRRRGCFLAVAAGHCLAGRLLVRQVAPDGEIRVTPAAFCRAGTRCVLRPALKAPVRSGGACP